MTTLMRNGRDRRSGKPAVGPRDRQARVFGWDPISGSHQGQRPERLHQKAGYMAAPERFADMADSSCNAGAVHTWPSCPFRCDAAIPSGYRGTFAVPMRRPACLFMTLAV